MKILLLPLDFLFLTLDTLRALLRLLPFWKKKQTCSVCGALVLEGESSRRVPSADKYFNLFMFRLLCPDVTEVAVAEDRERQCTQAEGSEGCRLRVWGCLLGLTAIWGMIFFAGISSQRTRAMAQPVATASETKIEEGRKVPVDSRGVEDVSLSGNGQPEKLIDRREARIQQLEAALLLYLRGSRSRREMAFQIVGVCGFYVLCFTSKAMGLTLPLMLVAIELLRRLPDTPRLKKGAPLMVLGVVVSLNAIAY